MAKVLSICLLAFAGVTRGCEICEHMGSLQANNMVTKEDGTQTQCWMVARDSSAETGDSCTEAQFDYQLKCCDGAYSGPKLCTLCGDNTAKAPGTATSAGGKQTTCGELTMALWMGAQGPIGKKVTCKEGQDEFQKACCDLADQGDKEQSGGSSESGVDNASNVSAVGNDSNDSAAGNNFSNESATGNNDSNESAAGNDDSNATAVGNNDSNATAVDNNASTTTTGGQGGSSPNATGNQTQGSQGDKDTSGNTTSSGAATTTFAGRRFKGGMALQVANAEAFVKNPATVKAVEKILATFLGLSADWITVTLKVGQADSRGLKGEARRLADAVQVDYTISVPEAAAQSSGGTLDAAVAKLNFSPGDVAAKALTSTLATATGESITVLSVAAPKEEQKTATTGDGSAAVSSAGSTALPSFGVASLFALAYVRC